MAQSIALASNFCLPGAAAMLTRSQHSGGAENSTGGHSKTHGMVTRRSALGDISNKGGAPSNNVNGGVKVHLCGDGIVCGEARPSTTSMYDCSWRVAGVAASFGACWFDWWNFNKTARSSDISASYRY
jgi:hypothetical protein